MESLNQYLQVQKDENQILKNEIIQQLEELFFPLQHTMTILGGISARHSNFISELCQYEQKMNRKLTEIKYELKKFRIQNKYPVYNPPITVSPCSDDYLDDIKTLKENSSKLLSKLEKLNRFEESEKVVRYRDINNEQKLCTKDESQGSEWLESFESSISQKKDSVSLESLESLGKFTRLEGKIRNSQETESIDPEQLTVSIELNISKEDKSIASKQSISPENSFAQEPSESTHSTENSANLESSISEENSASSKKPSVFNQSVNLEQSVSEENYTFSEEPNEFDISVEKSVYFEHNVSGRKKTDQQEKVESVSFGQNISERNGLFSQEQLETVKNSVSMKQYSSIESLEKSQSLQQSFSQETVESPEKSVDLEHKEGADSFLQSAEESVNREENISVENLTQLEPEKSVSLEQGIEGVDSYSQEAVGSMESVENSVHLENISVENLTHLEPEKYVSLEQSISEGVDSYSQEAVGPIESVEKSVILEENISVENLTHLEEIYVSLEQSISEGVDSFSQEAFGSVQSVEKSVNLEENISVGNLVQSEPENSVSMEQSISEGVDSFSHETIGSEQSVEKSVNLDENISVENLTPLSEEVDSFSHDTVGSIQSVDLDENISVEKLTPLKPENSVSLEQGIPHGDDSFTQEAESSIQSVEKSVNLEENISVSSEGSISSERDTCSQKSVELCRDSQLGETPESTVEEKYNQSVISKYAYQECMDSSFSETDYEEQEDDASESQSSNPNSSASVEIQGDQTNTELVQEEIENLEYERDEIQNNISDFKLNEIQDSKSFESKNFEDVNDVNSSLHVSDDKSIEVIEIHSSNDEMAGGQSFHVRGSNSNVSILSGSECDSGVPADSTHEVEEDYSKNVCKNQNESSLSTIEKTGNLNLSSGRIFSAKRVWWKDDSSDESKSPASPATNVDKQNLPVFSAEEKIKKLGLEDRRTLFERTRKVAKLPDLRLKASELPATDNEKLRWKKNKESGKYEIVNPEPLTEGMVCVFSHVESPVEFYLHPNVEEAKLIDCLNEMMTEYYIKTAPIYSSKIEAMSDIDRFCCAFVKEDKMYYRVEIFDWLMEKSEKVLLVQLVDYGNYQIVHFKHLRRLTLQFSSLPKLAVRCYFPLLYPPGSRRNQLLCTWPRSSIDALFELSGLSLQQGRFFFRIVHAERERNITAVDMYQIIGPDPNTLGQILIDLGHAVQIILPEDDPLGILTDEEDIQNLEKCDNLNEVVLGYDPKDESRICKFTRKDGGKCFKRSCKLEHVPYIRDGFTTDKTLTYTEAFYDMKPLKPKEFTAIRFTTLIDATRFYGNLMYYVEDLRRLEVKMNDPYNTSKFEQFKILPAHSEIVLVHHWQKRWLRAKVRHHIFNDDGVCVGVQVFMVDYGDIIDVRLELIRKIKMEYLYLPFQVIECEISNYEASPSYEREKMDKFFYEKMVFRNFSAKVVAVSDMQVCLEVYFKDRKLGDILAEHGFLQKAKHTKLYPHENSLLIPG